MDTSIIHTDQLLFARIAAGDEAAFRSVFAFYHEQLYPYVLSLVKTEADAREVLQEVFLRVWVQRAELPDVQNPGGWLRTITGRIAFTHVRKRLRYLEVLAELTDGSMEMIPASSDEAGIADLQELVARAAELLPERRRQVFRLSKLEGYSRKEIAEQLNLSENTVRNQLAEAMAFLQSYLQEHRGIYIPASVLLCIFGGH